MLSQPSGCFGHTSGCSGHISGCFGQLWYCLLRSITMGKAGRKSATKAAAKAAANVAKKALTDTPNGPLVSKASDSISPHLSKVHEAIAIIHGHDLFKTIANEKPHGGQRWWTSSTFPTRRVHICAEAGRGSNICYRL